LTTPTIANFDCTTDTTARYLITHQQLTDLEIVITTDSGSTSETAFDSELYDLAYEGVIGSWVIGLGIGFILAMLAKLKR